MLLSEYLQEVGRGGRDGKCTDTLTLISEPTGWLDPQDKGRDRYFFNQLEKMYQKAQQISKKIPSKGEIKAIARQFPEGEMALSLLHSAGCLEWSDPFHYQLCEGKSFRLSQSNHKQRSLMGQYLMTRQCRWQFLLKAFGFTEEAIGFKCGHCDNCRRS